MLLTKKRQIYKKFLFLCLGFILQQAQAQKSAADQLGAWYMYNGSHRLSEKYALKTMAHFRYFELASEFQQEIYRLGINYTFNKKINLTLGTSYATGNLTYDIPSAHLYEWRLYEDLNIKSRWSKFKARHRFRLEHRFIHKNINTNETNNWLRYDLTVNYPISQKWSVYAFNELFLNIDRSKKFAQNWTGAGFLHQINTQVKLKMGYFQIKSSNSVLKRVQLGIILNTDSSKKTKQ